MLAQLLKNSLCLNVTPKLGFVRHYPINVETFKDRGGSARKRWTRQLNINPKTGKVSERKKWIWYDDQGRRIKRVDPMTQRGIEHDTHGTTYKPRDEKGEVYRKIWLRPNRAGYSRYYTRWLPRIGQEMKQLAAKEKADQKSMFVRPRSFDPKHDIDKIITVKSSRVTGKAFKEDTQSVMKVRPYRRYRITPEDDWPSHWPTAKVYNFGAVPLPIRMEYRKNTRRLPRDGYANTELLKVPNFLHLAPAAIKRQCEEIKKFFTPWPEFTPEDKIAYFPLHLKYSDYIHQSCSLRDCRSRTVTMNMPESAFDLKGEREFTKFRQLSGKRFDLQTRWFTIVIDRCYTRQQNLDYAEFLVTVLYSEVKKIEPWESLKTRKDYLYRHFKGSMTEMRLLEVLKSIQENRLKLSEGEQNKLEDTNAYASVLAKLKGESNLTPETLQNNPEIKEFCGVWYNYRNKTETATTVRDYAKSVQKLLGLPEVKAPWEIPPEPSKKEV